MKVSDESEFLTRLFGAAADGMILIDGASDQVLAINQVAKNQLGLTEASELPAASALFSQTPGLLAWLQSQVVDRGIPVLQTACFGTSSHHQLWLEFSASSLLFQEQPRLLLITRVVQDQQQLQTGFSRLNRLYAMLSHTNKAVTKLGDPTQLFDEMCRIAVEEGGFHMAWMGLIDGDIVRPDSYAGAEQGYLRAIEVRLDDSDLARGPIGLAANRAQVQCVNDALNDPKFLPWRQAATDRGFQALAALPVALNGKVVGVFAMYSREPHVFDEAMLDLLRSMSDDISFAISHIEQKKARREAQDMITRLAYYDPLTERANRRRFNDRLEQAIKACERDQSRLALLFLDLDGFKNINDSLGHAAGDHLLQVIAKRLVELLRGKDTVARMGGDEFTVLLTDMPALQTAADVSLKIIDAIKAPISIANYEVSVTTSIGIALVPDHGNDSDTIMRNADLAMYSAKSKGKNNYQLFQRSMYEKAKKHLVSEQELRR